MTLKDIAAVVERNESTVSRAISNKYIDTPQGTFPLKFFFSQGLQNNNGNSQMERISSRSVKEAIKKLIHQENSSSPLSDQDIQDHFARQGITLARRTIAKYRQSLRILPSYLRKN